jgi:hypothetical protein
VETAGKAGAPPACAACPHSFDGVLSCTIASAGVAIMANINAETKAAAKTLFTLLTENLLPSLPHNRMYASLQPLDDHLPGFWCILSCATSENSVQAKFAEFLFHALCE